MQIDWSNGKSFDIFRAEDPVGELASSLETGSASWVVIEQLDEDDDELHLYTYRPQELLTELQNHRFDITLGHALGLESVPESITHDASTELHGIESFLEGMNAYPGDAVVVIRDNVPIAVGEVVAAAVAGQPSAPHVPPASGDDLGPLLGTAPADEVKATDMAERVDAVLSAEAPREAQVGREAIIDVRAELATGATPLAESVEVAIDPNEAIVVILTVLQRDRLQTLEPRVLRLDAPSFGQPSLGQFIVRGHAPGETDVVLGFRQGATQLAELRLRISVSTRRANNERTSASAAAVPRDPTDKDVLVLLVDEETKGNQICYRYLVHSDGLGLHYQEYLSKPVVGDVATASRRYVSSIYKRIVERAISRDDVAFFQREVKGIGADMCRQLFDPEFVRLIWDVRDDFKAVEITSTEPYIPWELVRLQLPGTRKIDDRYLSEYGLVRWLRGRSAPPLLPTRVWRYLVGEYPAGTQTAISHPDRLITRLASRGVVPERIEPAPSTLLDMLADPQFDVLHILCHGDTELDNIEAARLILGDRASRRAEPFVVDATTVAAEARLDGRTPPPLVFLSACESGQQGFSLTDQGGWPRAFISAGAGSFVGTSWSVREQPALEFALAFYDTLLSGEPLYSAANAGRAAAKTKPDASWLAFVVYGRPTARMQTQ